MADLAAMTAVEGIDPYAEQEAECVRLIDAAEDIGSFAIASSKVHQLPRSMPEDRYQRMLDRLEARRMEIVRRVRFAG